MTTQVENPMLATPAADFYKSFLSGSISLSAGLVTSQAHGLSAQPKLVKAAFVCSIANLGYSPGDLAIPANQTAAGGVMLSADGINVYAFVQGTPSIPNKSTGVPAAITLADWVMILRAWA